MSGIGYQIIYTGIKPNKMNQKLNLKDALKRSTVKVWENSILEAPRITGQLKRSIQTDYSTLDKLTTSVFSTLKYASYVHSGTSAHDIKPKRKKALHFNWMGAEWFLKRVHVGAISANPFFERAITKSKSFIEETFKYMVKKIK